MGLDKKIRYLNTHHRENPRFPNYNLRKCFLGLSCIQWINKNTSVEKKMTLSKEHKECHRVTINQPPAPTPKKKKTPATPNSTPDQMFKEKVLFFRIAELLIIHRIICCMQILTQYANVIIFRKPIKNFEGTQIH